MDVIDWYEQRGAFLVEREKRASEARQRLVLQILCNTDLDQLIGSDDKSKSHMCRRLKRLVERERLKGVSGHWSYDLNRHIGLKQALDTLKSSMRQNILADAATSRGA
jgi:hypothetical protein